MSRMLSARAVGSDEKVTNFNQRPWTVARPVSRTLATLRHSRGVVPLSWMFTRSS